MNVYLREMSAAMTNFPEVKMDIFTRVQNPKIKGIRDISPKVRVIHLKGGPEHPVDRKTLCDFLPEFSRNLEEFIIPYQRSYDLVYSHYWLSGLVGEEIRNNFSIPLIHIFHTLAFSKQRAAKENYEEHRNRLGAEEHLAHVSEAIISSSEHEKQSLIKEYGIPSSKLRVIYPGVNKGLFYPLGQEDVRRELGFREEDKIVLYVGRIEPVKGLLSLIEALESLRKKAPFLSSQLKLIVVGGGTKSSDHPKNKEINRIQKAIAEKNLWNDVFFLGSKRQNQLKKYYSAADVLVMPSLYESFGLVVVEALACGTPVIASRIGEMMNIIKEGKNGSYFNVDDPSSLSLSLNHFFSQKSSLWRAEKIRQDIISRFLWETTAKETYGIFKAIVGRSTTRRSQPDKSPRPA
ncbi:MAG: glycosyltransferase [Candidatus Aminicenantes bacterium]|nr:glycosyltransferase [Candidatus Aminicenantes bacterium]